MDGQRYIVGGLAEADWVKNARAAGWGILARGRRQEQVALVEVPVDQRDPILRAFPHEVPHGVQFFQQLYKLPKDPAALQRRRGAGTALPGVPCRDAASWAQANRLGITRPSLQWRWTRASPIAG